MAINVDINASLTLNDEVAARNRPGIFAVAALILGATGWASAVAIAAETGTLGRLYQPLIAAIVAATIAVPTLCYFISPSLRRIVEAIGHRWIVVFHI